MAVRIVRCQTGEIMLEKAIRDALDHLDDEEYSVRLVSWSTLVTHDYILSRYRCLDSPISREQIPRFVSEAIRQAYGGDRSSETPFVARRIARDE